MAGTTVSRKPTVPPNSDLYATIVAVNKLVDDVETLRAAIDAIADKLDTEDVANLDTNYAATAAVATASVLTAAKVGNENGTAFA